MIDFPTLLYTSICEIPTLLYTWSLKKVPLSGGASPYSKAIIGSSPPGLPHPFYILHSLSDRAIIMLF